MKKSEKFSPEVIERAVRLHHRLLEPIGYIPPAEAEANYYQQLSAQARLA
jgi:hypothetical protein